MGHIKIVLAIAITMAIAIAVTAIPVGNVEEKRSFFKRETPKETLSIESDHVTPQRNRHTTFSRFLMEKHSKGPYRNPNAADHCNKNPKICNQSSQRVGVGSKSMACCGNKCVDLTYDNDNCGACKKQCKFTQTCCRGQCVYLAYDKRHCGQCNHRCPHGEFCVYGLCNYA